MLAHKTVFFLLFTLEGRWKRGRGGWGLKFGLAWHRVPQRLVSLWDRHRDEVLATLGKWHWRHLPPFWASSKQLCLFPRLWSLYVKMDL